MNYRLISWYHNLTRAFRGKPIESLWSHGVRVRKCDLGKHYTKHFDYHGLDKYIRTWHSKHFKHLESPGKIRNIHYVNCARYVFYLPYDSQYSMVNGAGPEAALDLQTYFRASSFLKATFVTAALQTWAPTLNENQMLDGRSSGSSFCGLTIGKLTYECQALIIQRHQLTTRKAGD